VVRRIIRVVVRFTMIFFGPVFATFAGAAAACGAAALPSGRGLFTRTAAESRLAVLKRSAAHERQSPAAAGWPQIAAVVGKAVHIEHDTRAARLILGYADLLEEASCTS